MKSRTKLNSKGFKMNKRRLKNYDYKNSNVNMKNKLKYKSRDLKMNS